MPLFLDNITFYNKQGKLIDLDQELSQITEVTDKIPVIDNEDGIRTLHQINRSYISYNNGEFTIKFDYNDARRRPTGPWNASFYILFYEQIGFNSDGAAEETVAGGFLIFPNITGLGFPSTPSMYNMYPGKLYIHNEWRDIEVRASYTYVEKPQTNNVSTYQYLIRRKDSINIPFENAKFLLRAYWI